MAQYHCSVKVIGRSQGRSAVAAAAYRAAVKLHDERQNRTCNYSRKEGVLHTEICLPMRAEAEDWDRAQMWNKAEAKETRKNSTVAREYEIAIPHELTDDQKIDLVRTFGRHLAEKYQVGVDIAIHEPNKAGDDRNYHAHVMTTTRRIEWNELTTKTRHLDNQKSGEVDRIRKDWEIFQNKALEAAGRPERVDCRSNADKRTNALPTVHVGVAGTHMARKGKTITSKDRKDRKGRAIRYTEIDKHKTGFLGLKKVQLSRAEHNEAIRKHNRDLAADAAKAAEKERQRLEKKANKQKKDADKAAANALPKAEDAAKAAAKQPVILAAEAENQRLAEEAAQKQRDWEEQQRSPTPKPDKPLMMTPDFARKHSMTEYFSKHSDQDLVDRLAITRVAWKQSKNNPGLNSQIRLGAETLFNELQRRGVPGYEAKQGAQTRQRSQSRGGQQAGD